MRLQFLGTGGYHPNERRQTAGLFFAQLGVLLDAGTSTFRVQSRLKTKTLDIYLSHAHLDHVAGLTYLLVPLHLGLLEQVRVHARPQDLETIRSHLFSDGLFPVLPAQYEFLPLTEQEPLPGGGLLTHVPLQHPGGSVGYKLEWQGKSVAYITDTTASENAAYREFVRGVDLLVHECYFPDSRAEWCEKSGHSHTTSVAQLARDMEVGQLWLVHIDPQQPGDDPIGINTARAIFPQTFIAEDLVEVDL